jgi:transposase
MTKIKRATYDAQFKLDAIALAKESGKIISDVEKSLGLSQGIIGRWRKQLEKKGSLAFPGLGKEALTPEQQIIKELELQLKDAQMERDILKKAVGIFSKTQK